MTDAPQLERLQKAQQAFGSVVHKVGDDQWHDDTPCTDWDVRALVNHVAGELFWVTPMVDGKSIDDVSGALDGDLMGDDPVAAWDRAVKESSTAFGASGALDGTIQSSMGPMPVRQYLADLTCDLIVHRWDLGDAISERQRFTRDELEQLQAMVDQVVPMADQLVASGYFAAAQPIPADADPQQTILAALGRVD